MNNQERATFRQLWGNSPHTYRTLIDSFSTEHPCQIQTCENRAHTRIQVNVWGTVFDLDTCADCEERLHGKCLEELPELKPREAKVSA